METAQRGRQGPSAQEQRENLMTQASSSAKFLHDALQGERGKPRPWFDKHHLTFGGTRNELNRRDRKSVV